jgi:hypothetical protein
MAVQFFASHSVQTFALDPMPNYVGLMVGKEEFG